MQALGQRDRTRRERVCHCRVMTPRNLARCVVVCVVVCRHNAPSDPLQALGSEALTPPESDGGLGGGAIEQVIDARRHCPTDRAERSACRLVPRVREIGGVETTGCVGFPKGLEVAHEVVVRTVQGGCNRKQAPGDLGDGPGEVASRCFSRIAHGQTS